MEQIARIFWKNERIASDQGCQRLVTGLIFTHLIHESSAAPKIIQKWTAKTSDNQSNTTHEPTIIFIGQRQQYRSQSNTQSINTFGNLINHGSKPQRINNQHEGRKRSGHHRLQ
jgi:hypothetical protein